MRTPAVPLTPCRDGVADRFRVTVVPRDGETIEDAVTICTDAQVPETLRRLHASLAVHDGGGALADALSNLIHLTLREADGAALDDDHDRRALAARLYDALLPLVAA